jgi:hypothetical protein
MPENLNRPADPNPDALRRAELSVRACRVLLDKMPAGHAARDFIAGILSATLLFPNRYPTAKQLSWLGHLPFAGTPIRFWAPEAGATLPVACLVNCYGPVEVREEDVTSPASSAGV